MFLINCLLEPTVRFELTTCCLQNSCSTTELRGLVVRDSTAELLRQDFERTSRIPPTISYILGAGQNSCSTTELHWRGEWSRIRNQHHFLSILSWLVGRVGFEPTKAQGQLIYSQPRLTTSLPTHVLIFERKWCWSRGRLIFLPGRIRLGRNSQARLTTSVSTREVFNVSCNIMFMRSLPLPDLRNRSSAIASCLE